MPQPDKTSTYYRTFLFSMWEEVDSRLLGHSIWRFSLLNPTTAQRIGFKNLEELMRFLQQQIERECSDQTDFSSTICVGPVTPTNHSIHLPKE